MKTLATQPSPRSIAAGLRRPRPAGIVLVVVLGVLAITMALAYAVLRSQAMAIQLQTNDNRHNRAQQAAIAGLTAALHNMNQTGWAGVGSTLTGTLNSTDSYSVTHATGDASLTSGSPAYSEYPYRVTLTSTGYSTDPSNFNYRASFTITAVARLIPRKISTEPSDWATMLPYTVYQWSNSDFVINSPAQIAGNTRIQAKLQLSPGVNWSTPEEQRYYSDCNAARLAGQGDDRPFTANVDLPTSANDATTLGELTTQLGLVTHNLAATPISGQWTFPYSTPNYQLYPGGASYSAVPVATNLANVTLQADPVTNPLGVFYSTQNLTIGNNVTIRGTLVVVGSIAITGTGLSLQAAPALNLDKTNVPVQLPTIIASGGLQIQSTAAGTIDGAVVVWQQFQVNSRPQETVFTINGQVFTQQFTLNAMNEWNWGSSVWNLIFGWFTSQLANTTHISLLPQYCWALGLDPAPHFTINPKPTPPTYHWQMPGNPVFVAGSSDSGLRWDLVSWSSQQ